MEKVTITNSNHKLLYSDRFCCLSKEDTKIVYRFDDNSILTIVIKFCDDNDGVRLQTNAKENGTIEFILYNFKNPLGTGSKRPIKIGSYNEKDISVMFFAFVVGEASPILDLSLYIEV